MPNADLKRIAQWFDSNNLSLNVLKTKYMMFSKHKIDSTLHLKIGGLVIERDSTFKLPGLYIDEKMNWNKQIKHCKAKIASALYAIKAAKSVLTRKCLRMLYYTLVYPYISYGILVWGSAAKSHLRSLCHAKKSSSHYKPYQL